MNSLHSIIFHNITDTLDRDRQLFCNLILKLETFNYILMRLFLLIFSVFRGRIREVRLDTSMFHDWSYDRRDEI